MVIRVLPPAVAAGIAAGEVIERPASVVKELVENSLDAGASTVGVEVLQGGLQSIRVTDDGSGIAPDELRLAFERHATSKLRSLDDLAAVTSLGFRGEALASIAAAAHVRLLTRTAGAEAAAFVEIEGSAVIAEGTSSGAPGTSVTVEALFSTIPARLKFIRSASAETARIRGVLDHMAMACPHVRFSLRSEARMLLQTSGNGALRDVMAAVYGAEVADSLIEVTGSARGVYPVHGMVSPAERSRPNRTGMSLFVNGRWVSNRTLSVAVEQAYAGLLMEGRYPIAAMFVDVPPAEVDPNVHPNKREVRLVRDADAFSSVQRAVREALLADSPVAEARGLLAPPQRPLNMRELVGNQFQECDRACKAGSTPDQHFPLGSQTTKLLNCPLVPECIGWKTDTPRLSTRVGRMFRPFHPPPSRAERQRGEALPVLWNRDSGGLGGAQAGARSRNGAAGRSALSIRVPHLGGFEAQCVMEWPTRRSWCTGPAAWKRSTRRRGARLRQTARANGRRGGW